jgi:hypothetical protein
MDTSVDYMPTQYEFRAIIDKIKSSYPDNTVRKRPKTKFFDESDILGDSYDRFGRNISKQERRQDNVPWVRVVYKRGKLYIPLDKKNALRTLRLL